MDIHISLMLSDQHFPPLDGPTECLGDIPIMLFDRKIALYPAAELVNQAVFDIGAHPEDFTQDGHSNGSEQPGRLHQGLPAGGQGSSGRAPAHRAAPGLKILSHGSEQDQAAVLERLFRIRQPSLGGFERRFCLQIIDGIFYGYHLKSLHLVPGKNPLRVRR